MRKPELYAIATDDGIDLEHRYEAARQLQRRTFHQSWMQQFVRDYPNMTEGQLAEKFEIPIKTVYNMAKKMGLRRAVGVD